MSEVGIPPQNKGMIQSKCKLNFSLPSFDDLLRNMSTKKSDKENINNSLTQYRKQDSNRKFSGIQTKIEQIGLERYSSKIEQQPPRFSSQSKIYNETPKSKPPSSSFLEKPIVAKQSGKALTESLPLRELVEIRSRIEQSSSQDIQSLSVKYQFQRQKKLCIRTSQIGISDNKIDKKIKVLILLYSTVLYIFYFLYYIMDYRSVVERYQRLLLESKHIRQNSDRLSIAMKHIYLNPLLPQLSQSTNRLDKRAISLIKDPFSDYKQSSQDLIQTNLQNSLIKQEKIDMSTTKKKTFFLGLYKNQPRDSQFKNMKIKDLVFQESPLRSKRSVHQALPPVSSEIPLNKYFIKQKRKRKSMELSLTNKWMNERGTTFIQLEQLTPDQIVEQMIINLKTHEIMKAFFIDASLIQLANKLRDIINAVFYDQIIDFDIYSYFHSLRFTYLEVFYLKYSLAQTLITYQYSFSQIQKALNQFEEYRYLFIKPPAFILKLFESAFYSALIKNFVIKLLKSPAYNKFLQLTKLDANSLMINLRTSLFPYLVGDYLGLSYHLSTNEIKPDQYRQQIIQQFVNPTFVVLLKNILRENHCDELYIFDVERRLQFPLREELPQLPTDTFELFYLESWVQCKTFFIPSSDIKALLRVCPLSQQQESTIFQDNLRFLDQFDHIHQLLYIF